MLRQDVLKHPARVLTAAQRAQFFADGYLTLPELRTGAVAGAAARGARRVDGAQPLGDAFGRDLGARGGPFPAAHPRLHRVTSPQDQHPTFWDFMRDQVMTDLAADVVGPDVKFHHAKLNVKSERGTRGFKWHQDIPAWPHTDYSPVSIGVYIEGCTAEQGPLSFARGSHEGPLFSQYDRAGNFVVHLSDADLTWLKDATIAHAVGGPGTTVLLNCRTVHGSLENRADRPRPLLLPVYSSADSFAYTPSPIVSPHLGDVVRGRPARVASFDPRPCELPPDFRAGYNPPWLAQRDEEQRAHAGAS